MTDPTDLSPRPMPWVELEALRSIVSWSKDPEIPTIRTLLRHIGWQERKIAEMRREIDSPKVVPFPTTRGA